MLQSVPMVHRMKCQLMCHAVTFCRPACLVCFAKKNHRFSPSISLVKFTTRTSDPMQSKRSRALTVQKHAMFQLYMLAPTHGASRKLPTLYCSSLSWMGDNTNAATVDMSRARQAIPLISRWREDGTVQMPHLPWHRRKRSNKKAHRKGPAENLHSTFILPAVDESATCPITDIYSMWSLILWWILRLWNCFPVLVESHHLWLIIWSDALESTSLRVVPGIEWTLLAGLGIKNLCRFSEYEPGTSLTYAFEIPNWFSSPLLPCSNSIR